jgi:hypothetical protein
MMRHPEHLGDEERRQFTAVLAQCPELTALHGHVHTCYRFYKRWANDGTLARLVGARLPETDRTWHHALARRAGGRVKP